MLHGLWLNWGNEIPTASVVAPSSRVDVFLVELTIRG